nr:NADH dehydrogenase subunit 3 [Phyllozelus siccus siccus]
MLIMLILIHLTVMIALSLTWISSTLSMKTITDQDKSSPFECGFDPKMSARFPFSMHFFLIAMIFLIFDVEIALLLPMILILPWCNLMTWVILMTLFLIILLLGLYYEWNQGALEWAN